MFSKKNAIASVRSDQTKMMKLKNFQHKWLFNPDFRCCTDTDTWSLCYVDNEGMFVTLCQSHNGMYAQSK